ncbi:hypothetical protein RIEPE_0384 [Candidatus Riesia pediculicola USDA]|uniref:Uncharacterized protein n=1 Tax=Riesia pediculicola (strain USDA) TaxID=515618 RepID=D4G8H1_RIEPU|nr:hypothetical protein RIEPE_0384 [Candidatus Riesia pediculicola USDA]
MSSLIIKILMFDHLLKKHFRTSLRRSLLDSISLLECRVTSIVQR